MPVTKKLLRQYLQYIAQKKERKKLYQKMKNFGEGVGGLTGSNFTLKVFDFFLIVKGKKHNRKVNYGQLFYDQKVGQILSY